MADKKTSLGEKKVSKKKVAGKKKIVEEKSPSLPPASVVAGKEEEALVLVPPEKALSKNLPPNLLSSEDYGEFSLSPGASVRLGKIISSADTGLVSAAPIICRGPESCPYSSRCPIFLEDGEGGEYPLKKQCIVEANLIAQKFLSYIEEFSSLDEELGVTPQTSPTLRSLLSKLAEIDLYDYRVSLILAGVIDEEASTFLIQQTVAVNREDNEITQLQQHPAWVLKERLYKDRMDLLTALEATPRRKTWKAIARKQVPKDNLLTRQRELLEKLEEVLQEVDKSAPSKVK